MHLITACTLIISLPTNKTTALWTNCATVSGFVVHSVLGFLPTKNTKQQQEELLCYTLCENLLWNSCRLLWRSNILLLKGTGQQQHWLVNYYLLHHLLAHTCWFCSLTSNQTVWNNNNQNRSALVHFLLFWYMLTIILYYIPTKHYCAACCVRICTASW